MELTKTQKGIVELRGKNILVAAGAGTGKTRVLVERFLDLVMDHSALVTEILALTFTEKAAAEMKSRVLERLREKKWDSAVRELESAYISTFHAFAARLLKEHPIEAGIDPEFRVIESDDSDFLKEDSLDEVIEKAYEDRHEETLELLGMFQEENLREGILKIWIASRVDGKKLAEWDNLVVSGAGFNECLAPLEKGTVPEGDSTKEEIRHSERSEESKCLDPSSCLRGTQDDGENGCLAPLEPLEIFKKAGQLFEELGEKELLSDLKGFLKIESWTWPEVNRFKEWSKPFSRRGGKKDKPLWQEIKALCSDFTGSKIDTFILPVREKVWALALAFEEAYERKKSEEGVLDFYDLEMKLMGLFEREQAANQKILEQYRKKFKFIMVDEYQDTNAAQARLVKRLASGDNLFYVGDYKQSIYGFRGTTPVHFLNQEKEFFEKESGVCVPLLENFRTEEPVLRFINSFFDTLWKEDNLPFQELLARTSDPMKKLQRHPLDQPVTLLVSEQKDKESAAQARTREAHAVAERIRQFHEEGVSYGDMVILFQAMTASAIYEQALKERGVPYFVVSGRGFYFQSEIKDMMSFLAFLDNPLSDIPLAALLRSPVFQIPDDTLFWLARAAKKDSEDAPLYDGVKSFEDNPHLVETEKEKLRYFLKITSELMIRKDRLYLYELLDLILAKTGYLVTVLADDQGIRRYANLKKLVDLAREHELYEKLSLGDFIRIVRRLENHEILESEAQIEAEKSGKVVRLMTIHKAKGLEFPVTFIADLGHQSRSPDSKCFLADAGLGFSFQIPNPETKIREKPLSWNRINEAVERRETDEWKRLFYVAATRAKSKLILSGFSKSEKEFEKSFSEMSSWMDWLLSREEELMDVCQVIRILGHDAGRHVFVPAEKKMFRRLFENLEARLSPIVPGAAVASREALPEPRLSPIEPGTAVASREALPEPRLSPIEPGTAVASREALPEPRPLEELIPDERARLKAEKQTDAILKKIEPHPLKRSRVIDLPVSAYAAYQKNAGEYKAVYQLGTKLPEKSENLARDENALLAADFGTRMHTLLQWTDFSQPEKNIRSVVEKVFRGCQDSEIREAQRIYGVFLQSELLKEIAGARAVYRELPFVLDERHGRIHGVIDLLIEDARGMWKIIDYKTAEGSEEKVKASGYVTQMMIYALAVQTLFRNGTLGPQEAVLYFLKNNWSYRISIMEGELKSFQMVLRDMQEKLLEEVVH